MKEFLIHLKVEGYTAEEIKNLLIRALPIADVAEKLTVIDEEDVNRDEEIRVQEFNG